MPGLTGEAGDGVYGRFDGDLSYSLGLALEASLANASYRLGPTFGLRYFQTLGVRAAWLLSPEEAAPISQNLLVGLVIEPLFLLRFATDQATGQAFWDLMIDSVGLSTDLVLLTPHGGDFGAQTAFDIGLGGGLPLLARANGPWLRFKGKGRFGPAEPEALGELILEWQGFVQTPWIEE